MAAAKKAAQARASTFHDHIKELRTRVFAIAIVFIVASSVAYNYKDFLLALLLHPLGKEKLIFLTPAGGFSFIFQIALYAGLIVTIPVLIYNVYRFIQPILSKRAQRSSAAVIISSLLLLGAGVTFGYTYAIPAALQFLTHFADGYANASLTADSYVGFFMAYTAGLGLLFQLPLILLFIHWIHPLPPKKLFKFEKYMLLIAFIAAAMITPTPDLLNQVIVATPIILMYQIGVVAICVSTYRKRKAQRLATRAQRRQAKVVAAMPAAPTPVTAPARRVAAQPTQKSYDQTVLTPVATLAAAPRPAAAAVTASAHRPRRSIDGVLLSVPNRPPVRVVAVPKRQPVPPKRLSSIALSTNTSAQSHHARALDGVSLLFEETA